MNEKLKGIAEIAVAVIIAVVVLVFSNEIIALSEYGYLGVFIISLLSAATIFIPAPGWIAVIALGGLLNPYLLGIIAGIGSGIGELTGYMIGNGARTLTRRELDIQRKLIKKYGLWIIMVLAFIPNPLFDAAGLVAGALKIPVWKFMLATIAGRTVRFILLAYFGAWTLAMF